MYFILKTKIIESITVKLVFFGGRFNSHEYKFEEKIINERKNDQGYLLRTDYNCKSTENK